ncbi:MAG: DUF433 domain-containing protein [Spirochaetota bacterium]
MDFRDRVVSDPAIMLGKPVIKGTRITVELILRDLSEGMTMDDLLQAYPQLQDRDIRAALSYSASVVADEELLAI